MTVLTLLCVVVQSARRELWPALLGVLPAERRSPDSVAARKAWKREYKDLIRQWEDLYLDEESTGTQESQARAFSKEQWTKVRS